ncbi:hypothetical protein LTR36_003333 [Oleoguttula mirabilis]|uniref:Uncharacterized protein n=1 Tax=Oleoguttula mirabilis TaxID=1507867 RepID=A0AAV9JXH8_9PEZI|nr:hypothetical protein LTR36_003333 [Oleoguttula mirabilis]
MEDIQCCEGRGTETDPQDVTQHPPSSDPAADSLYEDARSRCSTPWRDAQDGAHEEQKKSDGDDHPSGREGERSRCAPPEHDFEAMAGSDHFYEVEEGAEYPGILGNGHEREREREQTTTPYVSKPREISPPHVETSGVGPDAPPAVEKAHAETEARITARSQTPEGHSRSTSLNPDSPPHEQGQTPEAEHEPDHRQAVEHAPVGRQQPNNDVAPVFEVAGGGGANLENTTPAAQEDAQEPDVDTAPERAEPAIGLSLLRCRTPTTKQTHQHHHESFKPPAVEHVPYCQTSIEQAPVDPQPFGASPKLVHVADGDPKGTLAAPKEALEYSPDTPAERAEICIGLSLLRELNPRPKQQREIDSGNAKRPMENAPVPSQLRKASPMPEVAESSSAYSYAQATTPGADKLAPTLERAAEGSEPCNLSLLLELLPRSKHQVNSSRVAEEAADVGAEGSTHADISEMSANSPAESIAQTTPLPLSPHSDGEDAMPMDCGTPMAFMPDEGVSAGAQQGLPALEGEPVDTESKADSTDSPDDAATEVGVSRHSSDAADAIPLIALPPSPIPHSESVAVVSDGDDTPKYKTSSSKASASARPVKNNTFCPIKGTNCRLCRKSRARQ